MELKPNSDRPCRYCSYYQPQGRRGGSCQRLNVPVASDWQACSLWVPLFEETVVPVGNLMVVEVVNSRG